MSNAPVSNAPVSNAPVRHAPVRHAPVRHAARGGTVFRGLQPSEARLRRAKRGRPAERIVIVRRFNAREFPFSWCPGKIRVELCIEPETGFLGFGSFHWDRRFLPCAQSRATKIYSHNFCYQERTVNIDVYVSIDTGSFSVAIILTYYHMLQYDL